ncbi:hypothetical protein [Cryptosporangium aurantiacum]|uniref:Uncharacterized protein n=1 Tax=Cryptosporangium aurantiacum TaxID=134849 RepID=A0A1M7QQR5_9ACTN|nr:hypothetical protein [Cryptosporangium aurantiacum]SHN33956.1 hypothetical protein SAMN05443668_105203 [Cryptosporangium aurantiacum]
MSTEYGHLPDGQTETPPQAPDGCAVSDVIAVVMRLLVDRGHPIDSAAMRHVATRTAAVGLLLAFEVRPLTDDHPWDGPPYYGLGTGGPFQHDGGLK